LLLETELTVFCSSFVFFGLTSVAQCRNIFVKIFGYYAFLVMSETFSDLTSISISVGAAVHNAGVSSDLPRGEHQVEATGGLPTGQLY
jgi:hypothetical protein